MSKGIKWIFLGFLGFTLFTVFAVSIVFFVMKLMKGEAYQLSLTAISSNANVIEIIGEPFEPSWYVLGSVNTSGPDGSASLEYAIKGTLSSGKVYTYATKLEGQWQLDKVVVSIDSSGHRISVIEDQ